MSDEGSPRICREIRDVLNRHENYKFYKESDNLIENSEENYCRFEFRFRDDMLNYESDKNVIECKDDKCDVRVRAGLFNAKIKSVNYPISFEHCRSSRVRTGISNKPYLDIESRECEPSWAFDIVIISAAASTGDHSLFPERKHWIAWR